MKRIGLAIALSLTMGAFVACGLLGRIAFARQTQPKPAAAAQVPGAGKAAELAAAVQIEPADLAKMLQNTKSEKPLVLHVGFNNFYEQASIPGSEYAGPGSKPEGLELLKRRVASLSHKRLIVLYCGCCPWDKCPNAKPAYEQLQAMGFTNVKVVHIAENFGANWVNEGLPTTKAQ